MRHGERTLLDSLLELAVEIAREGREGRRVGTAYTDTIRLGWPDNYHYGRRVSGLTSHNAVCAA